MGFTQKHQNNDENNKPITNVTECAHRTQPFAQQKRLNV